MLGGEVPETVMSGEKSGFIPFCEHSWCDWVKFKDETVLYSDKNSVLERYWDLELRWAQTSCP